LNREQQTFAELTAEEFNARQSRKLESRGITIRDVKAETIAAVDGPELFGYRTRRYLLRFSIEMQRITPTGTVDESFVAQYDMVFATEINDQVPGLALLTNPSRTGIEQFDATVRGEIAKLAGLPLRRVVTLEINEKPVPQQTVFQVTGIERRAIPDERFEVPVSFRKVSLPHP